MKLSKLISGALLGLSVSFTFSSIADACERGDILCWIEEEKKEKEECKSQCYEICDSSTYICNNRIDQCLINCEY